MTLDLYGMPMSACCRSVLLTAEAVGVPLNLKFTNLFTGEHLSPEFEQMNPSKKIPVLVDGDYVLSESRAIMAYLVDQYGKNERLYPKSPNARALVNQRMHFDAGTLSKAMTDYYYPVVFQNAETYNHEDFGKLSSAFDLLEIILEGQDYVAGRGMTIADLAIATTVSTAEVLGFDIGKLRNVSKWMERIKTSAPGYRKANSEGLEIMKKLLEDKKSE